MGRLHITLFIQRENDNGTEYSEKATSPKKQKKEECQGMMILPAGLHRDFIFRLDSNQVISTLGGFKFAGFAVGSVCSASIFCRKLLILMSPI